MFFNFLLIWTLEIIIIIMEGQDNSDTITNTEAIAIVVVFIAVSFFLNIICRWGSKDPEDLKN